MKKLICILVCMAFAAGLPAAASGGGAARGEADGKFDSGLLISEHLGDSYWWHVTTIKGHHISIYLPIIAHSQGGGWQVFSSRHIAHGEEYRGFRIAEEGKYAGKLDRKSTRLNSSH